MRLLIAAVGRLKNGPERILCARYIERASAAGRAVGLAPVEVREIAESSKRLAKDRMAEEAKQLLAVTPQRARLVALDGRGRSLTSETFAAKLAAFRSEGAPATVFFIGGADGLGEEARKKAELVLAFGTATFPHQLARILLAEQVYRAVTILSGHPYHRGEWIRATRSLSSSAALLAALLAAFTLSTVTFAQAPAGLEAEKAERQRQLEVLRGEIDRAKDAEARLKTEIDAIKDDRKKLVQALLDAATRIRAVETRLTAAENRLPELDKREAKIKSSLESRRAVLAEVLAALQKIGRRPPPALILRPEDALDSVRSAILLGAIIPELKTEAETLAADLSELARVRREIAAERDALAQNRAALEDERRRIAALGEERRRRQSENEKALEAERTKTQALTRQVETVRELIARMEKEIASAARAAETARRETEEKTSAAAFADPARIAPALAFAQARGRLPLPVSGTRVREFGAPDGLGGSERGLLVMTRTGAQVTAPCDGWVVFAGNFRSYGQLLIINPGGGYHVLLAGMERITVELGQFVLAGEPVAVMGNGPRTATAVTLGSSQPVLHVEFRKDGSSIDSAPWWAATETEKARG